MAETALVVGMGSSGEAVARHLLDRGARVVAVDDAPTDAARRRAADAGINLIVGPDLDVLRRLVTAAEVVVPSPGVPEGHPVFALAEELGTPVRGEVELAGRWARRPVVAITGTNGKTTVTELVTAMLQESGARAVAAGNIGLPLSEAVRRDVDVFVAEVSSFQLRFTDSFRPKVAVWLNLAEDHLDWHADMAAYAAAKARIWANQGPGDVAVVNADDPVVMVNAAHAPSTVVTFGLSEPADYTVVGDELRGPAGALATIADLRRALPHDLANGLAAAAAALAAGATVEGVGAALRQREGGPHRVELVAESGGVRWYDDSKATNPHAALAALSGFESVVLIAGGRNKGLDLRPLASASDRVRGVVALGEAAPEVAAAFAGARPVVSVAAMGEAVEAAAAMAQPGDVVLLAPACASFDQYGSYAERGDDFARRVRERLGASR
ncbi:MAG: UDP-N-acetylmuramoyl-L-alanine--D-glutamate ligase [Actinomycetota bacterium]